MGSDREREVDPVDAGAPGAQHALANPGPLLRRQRHVGAIDAHGVAIPRGGAVAVLNPVAIPRSGAVTVLSPVAIPRGGAVTVLNPAAIPRGGAVAILQPTCPITL